MRILGHLLKIITLSITLLPFLFSELRAEEGLLTLHEGLRIVTEEGRLIRIAALNEEMARADISIARSRFFPSINAYVRKTLLANQPGARFGPVEVYTSEKEFLTYGINLNQTIYDFGRDASIYKASKRSLAITEEDMRRVRNLVALDFIRAYIDLLEIEKLISLSEKEVKSLETHLKEAVALFEEGMITKNERLEIEVKLSDARQRLLSLINQRSFYVSRLNSLLLMPLDRDLRPVEVDPEKMDDITPERLYQDALNLRPELKIIDNELETLRLTEEAKRAEYFPRIYLQAGYEYTENRYLLREDNWSLILGMNVNLFSGGSTSSEISKLKIRQRQLLEEKERLIDQIRLEVKRYFIEMKNAEERINVTKVAVSQAEENLRINKVRFEEGVGRSSDVLDAIALLTLAETNYQRARYEYLKAQAGLLYAIGKDLRSVFGGEYGRQ